MKIKYTALLLCLSLFILVGYSTTSKQGEFNQTMKLAKTGDVVVQMKLADFFLNAVGTEKDLQQSTYWYIQAARQANPKAYHWLLTQAYQDNDQAKQFITK